MNNMSLKVIIIMLLEHSEDGCVILVTEH